MWEINGKNNWVMRDETKHIIGFAEVDQEIIGNEWFFKVKRFDKRSVFVKKFGSEEEALKYAENWLKENGGINE